MPQRVAILVLLAIFIAACGSVAEPRPTFEATNTALPRVANIEPTDEAAADVDDAETGDPIVAEVATDIPPTATPQPTQPPTATPQPTEAPTEIPEATATPEPTEAPVEEGVMVNGVAGDAVAGEFWFNGGVQVNYNNVDWQCSTCHVVAEPAPGTGPYLYGIATVAEEHGAVEGLSAVDYLYDSIVNPNHIIAPNQIGPDGTEFVWEANIMPNNWTSVMDEVQIADLVAYLMSLGQPREE